MRSKMDEEREQLKAALKKSWKIYWPHEGTISESIMAELKPIIRGMHGPQNYIAGMISSLLTDRRYISPSLLNYPSREEHLIKLLLERCSPEEYKDVSKYLDDVDHLKRSYQIARDYATKLALRNIPERTELLTAYCEFRSGSFPMVESVNDPDLKLFYDEFLLCEHRVIIYVNILLNGQVANPHPPLESLAELEIGLNQLLQGSTDGAPVSSLSSIAEHLQKLKAVLDKARAYKHAV